MSSANEINDATTAYKSAKAVQKGWKLWCMWSKDQPMMAPKYEYGGQPDGAQGFVVQNTTDMRKMAMDLLALADAVEEIESMWNEL